MTKETAQQLEVIYIQSLETAMVAYLSVQLIVDEREAMDIYYKSTLCQQIHEGKFDIQYLDYKYLVDDLIENEIRKKKR